MQTIKSIVSKKINPPSWQSLFVALLIIGVTIGSFIVDLKGLLLVPFLFTIWQKTSRVINL